jgi:hypothetical protein
MTALAAPVNGVFAKDARGYTDHHAGHCKAQKHRPEAKLHGTHGFFLLLIQIHNVRAVTLTTLNLMAVTGIKQEFRPISVIFSPVSRRKTFSI